MSKSFDSPWLRGALLALGYGLLAVAGSDVAIHAPPASLRGTQ